MFVVEGLEDKYLKKLRMKLEHHPKILTKSKPLLIFWCIPSRPYVYIYECILCMYIFVYAYWIIS